MNILNAVCLASGLMLAGGNVYADDAMGKDPMGKDAMTKDAMAKGEMNKNEMATDAILQFHYLE